VWGVCKRDRQHGGPPRRLRALLGHRLTEETIQLNCHEPRSYLSESTWAG
jgi:hypothetical protein